MSSVDLTHKLCYSYCGFRVAEDFDDDTKYICSMLLYCAAGAAFVSVACTFLCSTQLKSLILLNMYLLNKIFFLIYGRVI